MSDLRPDDVILVTGTPTSCAGTPKRYDRLRGTVATVSADGYFKLWPDDADPQLDAREVFHGKMWFRAADCVTEVIERDGGDG